MAIINKTIANKALELADAKMLALLHIATEKGGFDKLSSKQTEALEKYTQIVKTYEDATFTIPMPQTV